MMKLYLSGPMRGYPGHNRKAFEVVRGFLRTAGYEVVCPAELGTIDDGLWHDYLRRDLKLLLDCDGVALLDGWEASKGSRLEVAVANELMMIVMPFIHWLAKDGQS